MAKRGRPGLPAAITDDLWARFVAGESMSAIARALGKYQGTIYNVVRMQGGIVPPARCPAAGALGIQERETISRGVAVGESVRALGRALDRAPSSISREITRNGGRDRYRALEADARASQQARRPKRCKLATTADLCAVVEAKLKRKWSPEQIAGWLVSEYPEDPTMRISHETIYRSLFVQARAVLKHELTKHPKHLRTRRPMRRSKRATTKGQPRGQIIDAVSIAERPPSVEDRAIPGHWEGDLLAGAKNTHIGTLVERKSRYTLLVQVDGKDTTSVVNALIREVQRLPAGLMASLTWDRGREMAQHHRFAVATDVAVYFCDLQSPWQRGTNENTNGLLRQYFPDGTNLSGYTQRDLDKIAQELNTRPRKTLGFRTPAAILAESVAPIN